MGLSMSTNKRSAEIIEFCLPGFFLSEVWAAASRALFPGCHLFPQPVLGCCGAHGTSGSGPRENDATAFFWGRKHRFFFFFFFSFFFFSFFFNVSCVLSCGPQRIPQLWAHRKIRGPVNYRSAICSAVLRGLPAFPLQTPLQWFAAQSHKCGAALMNLESGNDLFPSYPQKLKKTQPGLKSASDTPVTGCWLSRNFGSCSLARTSLLNSSRGDL